MGAAERKKQGGDGLTNGHEGSLEGEKVGVGPLTDMGVLRAVKVGGRRLTDMRAA